MKARLYSMQHTKKKKWRNKKKFVFTYKMRFFFLISRRHICEKTKDLFRARLDEVVLQCWEYRAAEACDGES